MTPLDTYFDHGQRPRNMGRMLDAHGTGNVGSIVSGRALRWFVTWDGERILAAKFQVFACQEQVAAASILSELVVGKSLAEAGALGHGDIAAAIGGLDMDQLPPQLWGVAGLHDAIAHLQQRDGLVSEVDEAMPDGPLLCRCHGVDEATIKEIVRAGAGDLAAVQEQSAAGTGCGTCRRDIERIIAEVSAAPQSAAQPEASSGAKGRVALMRSIVSQLAPILEASPGLELWDLRGSTVILRSPGAPAESLDPLQDRAERRLKDEVDPLLSVVIEIKDAPE